MSFGAPEALLVEVTLTSGPRDEKHPEPVSPRESIRGEGSLCESGCSRHGGRGTEVSVC